jgi:hypothetical protein
MSDDLKPCPFCGGRARYRTGCGVECSDCFANIVDAGRIPGDVINEWNKRHAAAALTEAKATIARLEAALETAKLWLDDYNTPPSVYDKIDAALSPDEPKIPTKAE